LDVLEAGVRLRAGRYELEQRLGAGAAASVWLARDTLLERPVAVKVLAEGLVDDRAWLARFRREARVAAGLQHPNLVSIYDFNADVERPYLVMAYMPGGSLQDLLDAGERPDAMAVAADLLRALAHIHAAGVMHRDVKPGNVLFDGAGRACLTDFGVARPQDATAITQTGQIPGTAPYMAPELWRGEAATERTDLFALGVLLARCLDDEAPARLIGLTERLSAENPELRPASAKASLDLLKPEPLPAAVPPVAEPVDEEQAFAPPPAAPPADAEPGPGGVSRWLPVAALCLIALVVGFALASALGGDEENPPATERASAPERESQAEGGSGQESGGQADQSGQESESDEPPPAAPAETAADPVALNNQGFALINDGAYVEAIPILQRSVEGFESAGRTGEDDYAYALYNLGNALRLAGRPEDAIPILEQRVRIPNQVETVRAELKQARKDLKAQENSGA
jgi:eukaryotic-like serine/threonine-protein kinase